MEDTKPVQGTEERASALVQEAVQRGAEQLKNYDVTGGVSALGRALHKAADSLHDDGYDSLASVTDRAGDRFYRIGDAVKGRSLNEVVREAQHFAHENPGAFVIGCALAGFALARFFTTTSEHREYREYSEYSEPIPVAP